MMIEIKWRLVAMMRVTACMVKAAAIEMSSAALRSLQRACGSSPKDVVTYCLAGVCKADDHFCESSLYVYRQRWYIVTIVFLSRPRPHWAKTCHNSRR